MNGIDKRAAAKVSMTEFSLCDDFRTPSAVFNALSLKFGPFNLDVAASDINHLCQNYFTFNNENDNGLIHNWRGVVWCNPPYDNIKEWVQKTIKEVKEGLTQSNCERVLMLIPFYSDISYFHDLILPNINHLVLIRGRVNFEGPFSTAGGASRNPSAAFVFDKQKLPLKVHSMDNKGRWLNE